MERYLYNIDREIRQCFDFESGEILDEERLAALGIERDEKIRELILLRREYEAKIEGIKHEKANLDAISNSHKSKIEQIDKWLSGALQGDNYESDDGMCKVTFKRSKSVEVYDMDKLIEFDLVGKYLRFGKPEPNKTEISKAIKSGQVIAGCALVENVNMSVK